MVNRETVLEVLRTIDDPEMPVSIVDLGMVEAVRLQGSDVSIDVLPTFVGCHALPAIETEIRRKVAALPDVGQVDIQFRYDPPWSVERISATGREALRRHGITVPSGDALKCPHCGSIQVRLESPFGPTRCRTIYYCEMCRNTFEHLKRVPIPAALIQVERRSRQA